MKQFWQAPRTWALLAVVGSVLVGFSSMFVRLRGVFADPIEDMSFGWLVPIFSLYVLWTERAELRRHLDDEPCWWGLLFAVPCILLALFGVRGLQIRFEQVGFIGLCLAIPLAFYGRQMARLFIFPALFLAFTIPLATFLDSVTIHLRLLASGTAMTVLSGFGVNAVQQGTMVVSQGAHPFAIDVADPCSGLRSLFALMALTAAYSWYTQPTWTRRAVLFACAIPLAVIGNVARILAVCCVGVWGNAEFAMGAFHDYSGYVVFIVAISLMVACGELLTRFAEGRLPKKPTAKDEPKDTPTAAAPAVGTRRFVPLACVLVVAPLAIFLAYAPQPVLTTPPTVTLPTNISGTASDAVAYCQSETCGRMHLVSQLPAENKGTCPNCGGSLASSAIAETRVLPGDTVIRKRFYQAQNGVRYLVAAVIGGATKSSLHRPEVCMPAQGYLMRDPQDVTAGGRSFHVLRLERPGQYPVLHAYTFFNQAGVHTSSHTLRILTDVWDRSVRNRIDRWVMVTVHASASEMGRGFSLDNAGDRAAFEEFLAKLAKELP